MGGIDRDDLAVSPYLAAADQERVSPVIHLPRSVKRITHALPVRGDGKIERGFVRERLDRSFTGSAPLAPAPGRIYRGRGGGRLYQLFERRPGAEGFSEERYIRSVFQEPSYEIGHARDQFANGRVYSYIEPPPPYRPPERLGHAVEHLELEGVGGDFHQVGGGNRVADAAEIVGCDGGTDDVDVLEKELCQAFEIPVRLLLGEKDRNRPFLLAVHGEFVVPVSALHEPDVDFFPPLPGPPDEFREVFFGVLEVGLETGSP